MFVFYSVTKTKLSYATSTLLPLVGESERSEVIDGVLELKVAAVDLLYLSV